MDKKGPDKLAAHHSILAARIGAPAPMPGPSSGANGLSRGTETASLRCRVAGRILFSETPTPRAPGAGHATGHRPRCQRRFPPVREPDLLARATGTRSDGHARVPRSRQDGGARASVRPRQGTRVPRQPGARHRGLPPHRPRRAAGRRRGGVAVHQPRPRRPHAPPRTDPDARQLERPVARPGRHAEPERVADEGRHPLQHDLERGASRTTSPAGRCGSGSHRDASRTTSATRARSTRRGPRILPKRRRRGSALAALLARRQAILGVFDEGCMGMYNAIIPDHLLHRLGVFKERLSQSALYAAMREVSDETARRHYEWLLARGMRFALGPDPGRAPHRGAGARGPQDVRRRGSDGRSIRLRGRSASSTSRDSRT